MPEYLNVGMNLNVWGLWYCVPRGVCVYVCRNCLSLHVWSFIYKGHCVGMQKCVQGCMFEEECGVVCWMVCMNVASVCVCVCVCRNYISDATWVPLHFWSCVWGYVSEQLSVWLCACVAVYVSIAHKRSVWCVMRVISVLSFSSLLLLG